MREKIIAVLDVNSRLEALRLVGELSDLTGMFKVGSQLYMAAGPSIVREIVETGAKVFLDLKFHDIPNTVAHAAMGAARLGVSMMTIHASGGRAMMESVSRTLLSEFGNAKPMVVAVTVLTSLDRDALREVGIQQPVHDQVRDLALLAQDCMLDGVVCSPWEISSLRELVGSAFKLVTPGIRMPDQPVNDQQRTATPGEAISAGADYIVVGRAVTAEPDPRVAMKRLLESLVRHSPEA